MSQSTIRARSAGVVIRRRVAIATASCDQLEPISARSGVRDLRLWTTVTPFLRISFHAAEGRAQQVRAARQNDLFSQRWDRLVRFEPEALVFLFGLVTNRSCGVAIVRFAERPFAALADGRDSAAAGAGMGSLTGISTSACEASRSATARTRSDPPATMEISVVSGRTAEARVGL